VTFVTGFFYALNNVSRYLSHSLYKRNEGVGSAPY